MGAKGKKSLGGRRGRVGVARRHLPDKEPASWRARPRVRVARPKTPKITVIRKVDPTGSVSFAGTGYRGGKRL